MQTIKWLDLVSEFETVTGHYIYIQNSATFLPVNSELSEEEIEKALLNSKSSCDSKL